MFSTFSNFHYFLKLYPNFPSPMERKAPIFEKNYFQKFWGAFQGISHFLEMSCLQQKFGKWKNAIRHQDFNLLHSCNGETIYVGFHKCLSSC